MSVNGVNKSLSTPIPQFWLLRKTEEAVQQWEQGELLGRGGRCEVPQWSDSWASRPPVKGCCTDAV